MKKLAIIGGGPGGLISAYRLEREHSGSFEITLFEATERLGGKVLTRRFDSAPVPYEAGVAECYDYTGIGPDPLQQLIRELGLETVPTGGGLVVLDGRLLVDDADISRQFGPATLRALEDFRRRAASMLPISDWFRNSIEEENKHPWADRTWAEILDSIADPAARAYVKATSHSDLATEPCFTSALNGLKNFLMDLPGYVGQRSIVGGMEMLPRRLAASLTSTRVLLRAPVARVERAPNGRYAVRYRDGRANRDSEFDAVIVALPHTWLASIEWEGARLRRAMAEHMAHFNQPGHYLRVSALFRTPFWRSRIRGSYFMLDRLGGCCVYDEGSRHEAGEHGVLGWLLAGAAALSLGNLDQDALIRLVLDSLPDDLHAEACEQFVEGRVHRWAGAVSAQPGAFPHWDPRAAQRPEPVAHPGLVLAGDYFFDSTLNGVVDSVRIAVDLLVSALDGTLTSHGSARSSDSNRSPADGRSTLRCAEPAPQPRSGSIGSRVPPQLVVP